MINSYLPLDCDYFTTFQMLTKSSLKQRAAEKLQLFCSMSQNEKKFL